MVAGRAEVDWTSPEVLGAWSVWGPNRMFANCPYDPGSSLAYRWRIARDRALGIHQEKFTDNSGERDKTIERLSRRPTYD